MVSQWFFGIVYHNVTSIWPGAARSIWRWPPMDVSLSVLCSPLVVTSAFRHWEWLVGTVTLETRMTISPIFIILRQLTLKKLYEQILSKYNIVKSFNCFTLSFKGKWQINYIVIVLCQVFLETVINGGLCFLKIFCSLGNIIIWNNIWVVFSSIHILLFLCNTSLTKR